MDIFLVVIPLIIVTLWTLFSIRKNNKIVSSSNEEDEISSVSMQPRVIRDKNHKDFDVNQLMVPVKEKKFITSCQNLVKQNIVKFNDYFRNKVE